MRCAGVQARLTSLLQVLMKYGTPEQQEAWLAPLLAGEIRSCFAMTEPAVASSDATNIESSIEREPGTGDWVVTGRKWWTSGACDPRTKICVFMGKTDPGAARHRQQSMVLVPFDSPGVEVVRPLRCLTPNISQYLHISNIQYIHIAKFRCHLC